MTEKATEIDKLHGDILGNLMKICEKAKTQGSTDELKYVLTAVKSQLDNSSSDLKRSAETCESSDTKKMRTDSVSDTDKPKRGWADLPPELKMECIKHLDYPNRARFAMTSRAVKTFIESRKFEWDEVIVGFSRFQKDKEEMELCAKSKKGEQFDCNTTVDEDTENPLSKMFSALGHILKYGKINTLVIEGPDGSRLANLVQRRELIEYAPFNFSRLEAFQNLPLVNWLVGHNECPVDYIKFTGSTKDICKLPSLENFHQMKMLEVCRDNRMRTNDIQNVFNPLLEEWIYGDAPPIGTVAVYVVMQSQHTKMRFHEFRNRLVRSYNYQTDRLDHENRIITKDKGKHIWVRAGMHHPRGHKSYYQVKFVVISSKENDADTFKYRDDEYGRRITGDVYNSDDSDDSDFD